MWLMCFKKMCLSIPKGVLWTRIPLVFSFILLFNFYRKTLEHHIKPQFLILKNHIFALTLLRHRPPLLKNPFKKRFSPPLLLGYLEIGTN